MTHTFQATMHMMRAISKSATIKISRNWSDYLSDVIVKSTGRASLLSVIETMSETVQADIEYVGHAVKTDFFHVLNLVMGKGWPRHAVSADAGRNAPRAPAPAILEYRRARAVLRSWRHHRPITKKHYAYFYGLQCPIAGRFHFSAPYKIRILKKSPCNLMHSIVYCV